MKEQQEEEVEVVINVYRSRATTAQRILDGMYTVQVPWNYRYDDDSCARFGESNAFSLYRVGFAGIRNGEIRHGGLLADVHATIDKHAFETFSTSERVVRKMSRQKRKKEKKEEKGEEKRSCA